VSPDEARAREAELDEQEHQRMIDERTAEAIDGLYRAVRDCIEVAAEPDEYGLPLTLALVDGLLMAEHQRQLPWRAFPYERVHALNIEFLANSAEHFLADIRTAVMLLRSTGPAPGGRRHGVDPEGEERCVCGWRSTVGDLTPLTQHLRAVIELGGDR
jgi:hypothetical protein